MFTLLLLLIPAICVCIWVAFKTPARVKDVILKTPGRALVASTAISFGVSHLLLAGTMAGWAGLVIDLFLYPTMLGVRKIHFRQRPHVVPTQSIPASLQSVPA